MVSAQVKGKLRFYRVTPGGSKVLLYGNNIAALGPSGSSEGNIASTPEKWIFIPVQTGGNKPLMVNDMLEMTIELGVAATIDASDSEFSLAMTYKDGTSDTIGSPDDSSEWDDKQAGDTAFLANTETVLCRKTVRKPFALGSNTMKSFLSVENNA